MSCRVLPIALALLTLTCDDADNAPDDISSACRREAECSTLPGEVAPAESECRDRIIAEYDDATSYGCGSAYFDWVSCLATTRGQCRPPVADDGEDSGQSSAYVDPCQDARDSLRACQRRAGRE